MSKGDFNPVPESSIACAKDTLYIKKQNGFLWNNTGIEDKQESSSVIKISTVLFRN